MISNRVKNYTLEEYELDHTLLQRLKETHSHGQGSTFCYGNASEEWENHTLWKINWLKKISPSHIVEVGTHRGHFCYLAKLVLPEVKIHTFGDQIESVDCIEILNEYFSEEYITFTLGDSVQTFTEFGPNQEYQLAWIDGGHRYGIVRNDLENCKRLKIENLMIDDCCAESITGGLQGGPPVATMDFCIASNYAVIDVSLKDIRQPWFVTNRKGAEWVGANKWPQEAPAPVFNLFCGNQSRE